MTTEAAIERYRRWVSEQPCANCGKHGPSQVAHYVGLRGQSFGRGTGIKGHWLAETALCPACHLEVDEYQHSDAESRDARRIDRSEMFLYWILRTVMRASDEGVLP